MFGRNIEFLNVKPDAIRRIDFRYLVISHLLLPHIQFHPQLTLFEKYFLCYYYYYYYWFI